jgi:hypothetical protein
MADRIPITADYVRSRLDYDRETGVLTWKARPVRSASDKAWNTKYAGTTITHENSTDHIQLGLDDRNYLGHRIAWLIVHGECPPLIDHCNGIRNDNRLANLRVATRSQNASNSKKRTDNTSGFRGVHRKRGKKWFAQIGHGYRNIHLGTFDTAAEAACAYDKAAAELYGDFAGLNRMGG